MFSWMKAACLLFVLALPTSAAVQQVDKKPRVLSTSICADQYVLALADPDQIIGVSWQAGRQESFYRDKAKTYPHLRHSTEAILHYRPDIVVTDSLIDNRALVRIEELDIHVVVIPFVENLDQVLVVIESIGNALDQSRRATALQDQIKERLEALDDENASRAVALYVRPGGGSAGNGTLIDDVFARAGWRNFQSERGHSGWSPLKVEELVHSRPDLVTSSFGRANQESTSLLLDRHPVYKRLLRDVQSHYIQDSHIICGHPGTIEAVEELHSLRMNSGGRDE